MKNIIIIASITLLIISNLYAEKVDNYKFRVRASEIDSRTKEYPKIGYVFNNKDKVEDYQNAAVDVSVKLRGQLVIWMMSNNGYLNDKLNSYGYHVIQPHYARQWFGKVCREVPVGENSRGNMRLEAATGEGFSDQADIQLVDGMKERVRQFLIWLIENNKVGKWEQFLTKDKSEILWEKVVMSGSSHGSTTSARFAKHQRVARVVMLCGARDQYQAWQGLPSATPENRYFGFSHVLDSGWVSDHYCRSWELLGMHKFGPIVDIDKNSPPYSNTRRLTSALPVKDAKAAHGAVTPKKNSAKLEDGTLVYDKVWKYLYTHPVDSVGKGVELDESCIKDQRSRDF